MNGISHSTQKSLKPPNFFCSSSRTPPRAGMSSPLALQRQSLCPCRVRHGQGSEDAADFLKSESLQESHAFFLDKGLLVSFAERDRRARPRGQKPGQRLARRCPMAMKRIKKTSQKKVARRTSVGILRPPLSPLAFRDNGFPVVPPKPSDLKIAQCDSNEHVRV